jgi:hypothetical protein
VSPSIDRESPRISACSGNRIVETARGGDNKRLSGISAMREPIRELKEMPQRQTPKRRGDRSYGDQEGGGLSHLLEATPHQRVYVPYLTVPSNPVGDRESQACRERRCTQRDEESLGPQRLGR